MAAQKEDRNAGQVKLYQQPCNVFCASCTQILSVTAVVAADGSAQGVSRCEPCKTEYTFDLSSVQAQVKKPYLISHANAV
jgi:hypothetical protein